MDMAKQYWMHKFEKIFLKNEYINKDKFAIFLKYPPRNFVYDS